MDSPGTSAVAVVALARAPEVGLVKTRLAADLGPAAACEVHEALALDVLARLAAWAAERGVRTRVLALTGDAAAAERLAVPARRDHGFACEEQLGDDLGQRVVSAVRRRLHGGARRVLVVGTDCAELTDALLDEALRALADRDVALVPAADGGFVLLGARRLPAAALAGVAWGTDAVLAATEAGCRGAGLSVALVAGGEDVDTLADLRGLAARLRPGAAPRLAAWLAAHPEALAAAGSGSGEE